MISEEHKKYSRKYNQEPKYRIISLDKEFAINNHCEVCTAYLTWMMDIVDVKYTVEKL
jgi:hypothetical protein